MTSLPQETRIAFNVPAMWTNRFSIVAFSDGVVRIAFAEAAPGEDKAFLFHSAVRMSKSDATALRDNLTRLLV